MEVVGVLPKFEQVNLQERDLVEGLGVDGRTIGINMKYWVGSTHHPNITSNKFLTKFDI